MRRLVALISGALFLVMTGTACLEEDTASKQRNRAVNERIKTFSKAEKVAPTPKLSNFPIRKALVKYTEREDMVNHPWYTYVLGDNGNVLGYYVSTTPPINACNFLSSTEILDRTSEGAAVLTAPSLDGIYYGGAGASGGCDVFFFFDRATDALIKIRGKFYTADRPLRVDAEPIKVAAQ
jgi:hypothetical protein